MVRIRETIAVVSILLQNAFAQLAFPSISLAPELESSEFDWSSIEPSKKLVYQSCYEKFKCARLLVPLDWQKSEKLRYENTIAIAVIELPAKVNITDSTYRGPILTNPGGPGGSGVNLALLRANTLQWVVDSQSDHYDIVSFDPRGVVFSGPDTSCFSDPLVRDLWTLRTFDEGTLDSSDGALPLKWARTKAKGKLCGNAEIGEYVGTASVARDMLEIVERSEEARLKELSEVESRPVTPIDGAQLPLRNGVQSSESPAMLQYIGFSYGTFLGSTFASLFPDRVGRMILDGVVDADDYIAQGWTRNLQDTDTILPSLYKYCYEAGPGCPLYNEAGPEQIGRDMDTFLENLRQHPIAAVDDSGTLPPTIITYSEIKRLIFQSLYSPIFAFPAVANSIAHIRKGNYSAMLQISDLESFVHCPSFKNTPLYGPSLQNEVMQAVMCGDGDAVFNQTMPEFKSYLELLESQSSAGGAIWAELIRLSCIGWTTRSKWRFTGAFGAITSTPILWIGNTADPVTPIRNAYSMAKAFPGSAVLHHDAEGHCALFNAPSPCTIDVVRDYFSKGKLPKTGKTCPPDLKPFAPQSAINSTYYDAYGGQLKHLRWSFPSIDRLASSLGP